MTREYQDYLAHYGIKGQKWGVRNWQNEDGTYNDAGRERYWGGGSGRQPAAQPTRTPSARRVQPAQVRQPQYSVQRQRHEQALAEQEVIRRKQRRAKIIAIAAGISLTAALAYIGRKKHVVANLKEAHREKVMARRAAYNRKKYGDVIEMFENPQLAFTKEGRKGRKESDKVARIITDQYRSFLNSPAYRDSMRRKATWHRR